MSARHPSSTLPILRFFAFLLALAPAHAEERRDADDRVAFVLSNDPTSNSVLMFRRAAGGELTLLGAAPTGGRGTGAGLGNQGALALSEDGQWLVAVNPATDDITAFALSDGRLQPVSRVASGGKTPVSITIDDDLVYVLNAGSDQIAGFRLDRHGRLEPLADSVRPLSGKGVGAAEIGFTPGGRSVVVTEKATNRLTVYPIGNEGRPGDAPQIVASPGATPFGFSFAGHRTLLVTEAAGAAPGASAVSSYRVDSRGGLTLLHASVPTRQTAACWIVATPGGRFAYTANTPASTITGFALGARGALTLLDPTGVTASTGANSGPTDVVVADEGHVLYALDGQSRAIGLFRIGPTGALSPAGTFPGLPAGATGIVAR